MILFAAFQASFVTIKLTVPNRTTISIYAHWQKISRHYVSLYIQHYRSDVCEFRFSGSLHYLIAHINSIFCTFRHRLSRTWVRRRGRPVGFLLYPVVTQVTLNSLVLCIPLMLSDSLLCGIRLSSNHHHHQQQQQLQCIIDSNLRFGLSIISFVGWGLCCSLGCIQRLSLEFFCGLL